MTDLLSNRFSALKEKHKVLPPENRETKSEFQKATPLKAFLYIYSKSRFECSINYSEGAKVLLDYLAPIALPTKYPDIWNPSFKLPVLLYGYDTYELAKLLAIETAGLEINEALKAIYFIMSEELIYELSFSPSS